MASLTNKDPIPFDHELKHTETYLKLERKRFGDRLHVEFDIETRNFRLPSLSLQVLVENALRHGIARREEGGCVRITTRERESFYEVSVVDDGAGFDPNADIGADGRTHVGIANVRVRLAEGCNATLELNSEPDNGTVATMRIPKETP